MAGHRTRASQSRHSPHGTWEEGIEGSFRSIGAHQLYLAWWLHVNDYITRRQLRVYFAAHEMAERRRAAACVSKRNKPRLLYTIEEVADLVGGRRTPRAIADLKADIRRLEAIGLVAIERHEIRFAGSIEDINLEDASGFWSMFERVPNGKRIVPVPRRTLRAFAAGFSRAVTGVMLATLIRSLFWHKSTGTYRVDGRTKGSWIADVFGISRRAVTDARATLIELGWLEPCDSPQWALNRWGAHDTINTEWCSGEATQPKGGSNDNHHTVKSANPQSPIPVESASPDQTDSLPQEGNQETRRLRHARSRSGVRMDSGREGVPGRASQREPKRRCRNTSARRLNIRDIQPEDLANMDRLLELHTQSAELGLAARGEAGRLDFVALAEHARTHGRRAGALFYWLLRERKAAFITQSDEDRAAERLKEHLYGVKQERPGEPPDGRSPPSLAVGAHSEGLTDDEWFVVACVRVAQQHKLDPATVARKAKGWTQQAWDGAYDAFQRAQFERQNATAMEEAVRDGSRPSLGVWARR